MRDDRLRLRGVNTERERARGLFTEAGLTLFSTSPLINHSKDAGETHGKIRVPQAHTLTDTREHTQSGFSVRLRFIGVSETHLLEGVET